MRRLASCLLARMSPAPSASKQLARRLYATKLSPERLTPIATWRFFLSFLLFFLIDLFQLLILAANLFGGNQEHGDRFEFLQRGRGFDVNRRRHRLLIGQILDPPDQ